MITLIPHLLTQQSFAQFGDVIEATNAAQHFSINSGNTERFHDLANIDPGADGKVIVSIFRGMPRRLPFIVEMMERHPKGSQCFIPMSGRPYLVVVAPPSKVPTVRDLCAFFVRGDQGVNYSVGVWHHPLLALEVASDFIVLDRSGPGPNCDEIRLSEKAIIPAITELDIFSY